MDVSKTDTSILEDILAINLDRLRKSFEMEQEKNFVFPEGTAITKLILQIEEEIHIRKFGYNKKVDLTGEQEPKIKYSLPTVGLKKEGM